MTSCNFFTDKKSHKSTSLFKRYMLLYLITAFLPVLIACLSIYMSYQTLKTETIRSNQAAVHTIQQALDMKFLELDKILLTLGTNPSLTRYTLTYKPLNAISSLNNMVSQQDFVRDILITGDKIDNIYSSSSCYSKSSTIPSAYYINDFTKKGYTYSEWQSLLSAHSATYWPVNAYDNTPDYLYLFSPIYNLQELSSSADNNPYASRTAVILIRQDYIHDLFLSSQTLMDEGILLLDHDMNLLSMIAPTSSSKAVQDICQYLKAHTDVFEQNFIELEDNLFFFSRSEDTGFCYVRFLPCQIAYQSMNEILNYTIIILVLVALVGLTLVIFNTKSSYLPIRNLCNWVNNHLPTNYYDKNPVFENELTFLQSVLDSSFHENLSLMQTLDNSQQGLVDYLITALICGNFTTQEAFFNACHNLNIAFDYKYFCVCNVIFENDLSKNKNVDFETTMKYIYDSLPENLVLQAKNLLFSQKLILVLNCDSNDSTFLETTLSNIKDCLSKKLGLLISVGAGAFYDSYDMIGKSYLDSVNALDYRLVYGKSCIIMPNMYNTATQENTYPHSDLKLLQSALQAHNAELVTSVINRLNEYTKSSLSDLHSAKHICYDTFSILKNIPAFANVGYSSTLSNSLNIMHLSNFETIDDFFSSLLAVVYHTLGSPAKTSTITSGIENQFVDYINTHCFSYGFQISSMAEHFSISPQHMRKLFKKHTGIGISEYISNVKLEKAMQLLQETDMTLQDIVLEIGNTDVSGFLRSFKQKTGMTPGQYRKSSKLKEL